MKKALLLAAAVAVSCPVWAIWTPIDEGDRRTVLVDFETIRATSAFVRRVWVMYDYSNPDELGVQSRKGLHEVDCKQERWRLIQLSAHRGSMGSGEVVASGIPDRPRQWLFVAPGSTVEAILEAVCSP